MHSYKLRRIVGSGVYLIIRRSVAGVLADKVGNDHSAGSIIIRSGVDGLEDGGGDGASAGSILTRSGVGVLEDNVADDVSDVDDESVSCYSSEFQRCSTGTMRLIQSPVGSISSSSSKRSLGSSMFAASVKAVLTYPAV
jgi:hypothetical protein